MKELLKMENVQKLVSKLLVMCLVVGCFSFFIMPKTTVSAKTFNCDKTDFHGGYVSKITKNTITFGDHIGWVEDESDIVTEKYKTTSKTKYYYCTYMCDGILKSKKKSRKSFKKYISKHSDYNNCRFIIKNGKITTVIYGVENWVG